MAILNVTLTGGYLVAGDIRIHKQAVGWHNNKTNELPCSKLQGIRGKTLLQKLDYSLRNARQRMLLDYCRDLSRLDVDDSLEGKDGYAMHWRGLLARKRICIR